MREDRAVLQGAGIDQRDGTGAVSSLRALLQSSAVPCQLVLPGGERQSFGVGEPAFVATVVRPEALGRELNQLSVGRAYVEGDIDVDGDMMRLFEAVGQMQTGVNWRMGLEVARLLLFADRTRVNQESIAGHYTLGDDFYLSFLDTAYRFYSQCNFASDDQSLEEAASHKLSIIDDALQLGPGSRLLDIGAGWGGIQEYFGSRGVHVTSLTLTDDSRDYTNGVITRLGLSSTCSVHVEDFLAHQPDEPYDAIVILGVIEHIPWYRTFFERVYDCLGPSGRFYLDASASKEMFRMGAFSRRYIWPGAHTYMCLQEVLQELLYNGLDLVSVENDTWDYHLTIREWAARFDANRDRIVERWGEQTYRAFRVYLWGGAYGFLDGRLQAYHLVAEKGLTPGPRPGRVRRSLHFARSLVR